MVLLDTVEVVARTDIAFFEDPEVKADATALEKLLRELWIPHLDAEPVAGNARLGHLNQRFPDPKDIAYVDAVFGHPFNGEILAELRKLEVIPAKFPRPVLVMFSGVHANRLVDSTVTAEIDLLVAAQIQGPKHDPSTYRLLENSRANGPIHVRNLFAH
jgi:hypothetical protein